MENVFSSDVNDIVQLTVSVRDARKAAGLTQDELAKKIGVTRSWLSQFENGKNPNASISTVLRICGVLGVTLTISYSIDVFEDEKGEKKGGERDGVEMSALADSERANAARGNEAELEDEAKRLLLEWMSKNGALDKKIANKAQS